MIKKLFPVSILLVLIFSSVVAQTKNEIAVAVAVEKLRIAMIDADSNVLSALTSEQLSYGHSGGSVDSKKKFVEKIMSGKSNFVKIDLTEQSITLHDRTAIVRHILSAVTNDDGKPGEIHLKILMVWVKEKRQWKLLARQAVKLI